jgi:hypothetical protein
MHTYRFPRSTRVLAACCVLGLSACAHEALDNQLASSREAVDQARIAGAQKAAPADFDVAANKLDQATAAANTRDKDEAMRLAEQAQVDANLAHAKTDSAQARYAATEMEKSNLVLREALNRAANKQAR